MSYYGDLVQHGGTYEKDGQEKTRWNKLGAVFEKDGRLSVKMHALPLPDEKGEVWLKIFAKDSGQQSAQQGPPPPPEDWGEPPPF